jgi:hypothetical protein
VKFAFSSLQPETGKVQGSRMSSGYRARSLTIVTQAIAALNARKVVKV